MLVSVTAKVLLKNFLKDGGATQPTISKVFQVTFEQEEDDAMLHYAYVAMQAMQYARRMGATGANFLRVQLIDEMDEVTTFNTPREFTVELRKIMFELNDSEIHDGIK